jgi:TonB family protein
MAAELLEALVRANVAAGAAILLALLLRRPARRLFDARAAYVLWLTVPLAALASLLPRPMAMTVLEPLTLAASAIGAGPASVAVPGLAASILVAAWLGGAIFAAGLLSRRQALFMTALGRLSPGADGVLRAEHPAVGPAVVGALWPRIVTPADFETRFDAAEQALILAHEGVHLARGDGLVNALAAALQCVCWFNPLVHVAVRSLRIDQELACDAAVLARHPQLRRTYAGALLKAQLDAPALPVGCHWPATSEHPLKERIAMLKSPLPAPGRRIIGLAAAAIASLAVAGAAWAIQPAPAPARVTAAPVWITKPDGRDITSVYPAAALASGVTGNVLVACHVQGDGRLSGCKVLRETPVEAGFGPAFLKVAHRFQMAATDRNGEPTAGTDVHIPVRFGIPQ